MSSTLATGAYRRAVDRAHESLASVRLSLAPSSPTAPTGAEQGLRCRFNFNNGRKQPS